MPRRRTVAVAAGSLLALGALGVAAGFAVADQPTAVERSRAASERPCGRPYVEVVVRRFDGKARFGLDDVGDADQPAALAVDPTGARPTLVAEREGRVRALGGDVVLDLADDTSDHGDGGLLGLAYDPTGAWIYALRTTVGQDDELTAYPVDGDGRVDASAEVVLLESDHPMSEQHHGGGLAFGPDGMLYASFGDGGGLGDPGGNAQDGGTLLGKVVRIEPTPGAPEPYAVPADNPFVGRRGWRPEIWALGMRNPYRLSFDDATGDLWIGDVGQSCWEELNRLRAEDAGANLGWDRYEGTSAFEGGDVPGRAVWPEHVQAHRSGWCAIVAGDVVRNRELGALDGWLLFTDYCRGRVYGLRPAAGGQPPVVVDTGLRVENPAAIVEGPDGHPWILNLDGDIQRVVAR